MHTGKKSKANRKYKIKKKKKNKKKLNETVYRSAVGNLLYLAVCTRPFIFFSVSKEVK